MPYKLHHWDYDSDTDPGWPRRYLTYDYHTACWECHEPNGLLRVLQHLFGGPAVRCRHRRNKHGHGDILSKDKEWGGDVKGVARWKGCVSFFFGVFCLLFTSFIYAPLPFSVSLLGGKKDKKYK
ncbi:hypothetical protein GGR50DRAFT_650943 [Xylaria sp. CBS 124048]|nr:hypothetical protein GGR50DRAFT_650943 [Xylaria sp. CBS 124048]